MLTIRCVQMLWKIIIIKREIGYNRSKSFDMAIMHCINIAVMFDHAINDIFYSITDILKLDGNENTILDILVICVRAPPRAFRRRASIPMLCIR